MSCMMSFDQQKTLVLLLCMLLIMSFGRASHHAFHVDPPLKAQSSPSLQEKWKAKEVLPPRKCSKFTMFEGFESEAQVEEMRGRRRVGSTPPSCEHKCGNCNPCTPKQVPTITENYPNYEPEEWKCKCGSFFYNP